MSERITSVSGAVAVVRRGLAASPELRQGLKVTLVLALLSAAGRVAVPVLVQQVVDRAVSSATDVDLGTVATLSAAAAVVVLLTSITTFHTHKRLAESSEQALCGLRERTFAHIHRLSIAHHTGEHRGALVARVTDDVETLSRFFQWGGIAWLVDGAVMTVTIVTMLVYDWRLTLVALLFMSPLVPTLRWLQRRLVAGYDLVRTRVSESFTALSEVVQGADVVRAYGVEERTTERVVTAVRNHRESQIKAAVIAALLFPSNEVFAVSTVTAVVGAALVIGPGGGLTAGVVVAFVFLVTLFLQPVAEFTEILDQTQTAVAGWRKVLDVLDTPIDVVDPVGGGVPLPAVAPLVTFEHVSYEYRAGEPVLHDLSFHIEPGTKVALVGATGSGKTTIAKLLTRLADPTSGRVLVDRIDLREVEPSSLRRRLVMVPQDGFLFSTTVAANVRYGRPDATDDDVRLAFVELGLEAWVDALPDGIHTAVGQRGEHLSVGERQLVALARAYVANPTCLVLDEATSAVDPATDTRLQRALDSLSQGRTSVVIAHRLATAEAADRILVLDHGVLVEEGRHADLLARGGVYAGLHASWLDVTAAAPAS